MLDSEPAMSANDYVKNAWYVAAWDHELETGKPMAMTILDEPVVLYRTESGRVAALEDRCVHRLAPLSLGRCEGEKLRCMYHGLLFEPDGQCVEIPGQELIPAKARVRAFPVAERGGWIWIWMGEADRADVAGIPDALHVRHPDWIFGSGYMDYDAEARLITDNLLDLSHVAFLHADSFGSPPSFAETRPTQTILDRGFRLDRWSTDVMGPKLSPSDDLVDQWVTYDFFVPGVLLMYTANFPRGTAKACDFKAPDYSLAVPGSLSYTSHAVTPMKGKQARYFYTWAPHKDHGSVESRDASMAFQRMALEEDKVMIEAQQKIIDIEPERPLMPISHDRTVTLYERLVQRLIREDNDPTKHAA